ncbi:MAG: macro domain-containing protein [bacterium]
MVLIRGDITEETTDAIVNAANTGLRGGGGVDSAIHRAGGSKIMEECRKIGHCDTGSAVVTTGGNLSAKHVIHTVGPVYSGKGKDADLLASAYCESLKRVSQIKAASVSFPSISTGVYGYPIEAASAIALKTIIGYLTAHSDIKLARMVLFSDKDLIVYEKSLSEILNSNT